MRSGNADLHRLDHQLSVFIGGHARNFIGKRIGPLVRTIAGKLEYETLAFGPGVRLERPSGLVRTSRKLTKLVNRSRRTNPARHDRAQLLRKIFVGHRSAHLKSYA